MKRGQCTCIDEDAREPAGDDDAQEPTASKIKLTPAPDHTKDKLPSAKDHSEGQNIMHRGLGLQHNRVVTRSRSRDAAAASTEVASSAAPMLPLIGDHHAAANIYISNSNPDLKTKAAQHQAGHTPLSVSPYSSTLPAAIKLAAGSAASTRRSPTRPGRAQPQQPQRQSSNDLQSLVDAGCKFIHPSLLRHGGSKQQEQQQQELPIVTLQASGHKAGRVSKHASPVRPALAADSPSRAHSQEQKRVQFAPGPLKSTEAKVKVPITEDGHPATEGALAVPVRRVQPAYALDLTKGNVLLLEQLLGADCVMSVTRLKRRVGLLPPIRAPRPHATSQPASSGMGGSSSSGKSGCCESEAEQEAETAAAAASPADARNQQHKVASTISCAVLPGNGRAEAGGKVNSSGRL